MHSDKAPYMEPSIAKTCLPENNLFQVMRDLIFFESQIGKRFSSANTVYKTTCGKADCKGNH